MPRLVRRDATGPIKIEPSNKPVWICGCGLTRKFPFCDGSHRRCTEEDPHTLYLYEGDSRKVVEEHEVRE